MAGEETNSGGLRRATLKQVAERAGVSINTASVVLNPRRNQAVVHPDTRARVEDAARALGYRRNLAASRLAGGAANTFCILTDRLTNLYHSVILTAFVAEASREGFQCILACTEPADAKSLEYIRSLAMQGVDGFVFAPIWEDATVAPLVPALLQSAMHPLFIDYRYPGHEAPLVACDHRAGARLLAEHLLSKGHRRVLFVHKESTAPTWPVAERIAGAEEVVTAANGSFDVVSTPEPVADRLGGSEPPTAIMCANDDLAYDLLNRLDLFGKVAVTGFGDLSHFIPDCPPPISPLTTIRQPLDEIGRRVAQELVVLARGGSVAPNTDILLPGTLILRESSDYAV